VYAAFKEAQRRLAELELKRSQPQTDLDYIQYQLDELNQLNLEDQDWNALMEERDVLENGEAIREALTQALAALSDNDEGTGAVDRVQVAGKQLDTLGGIGNRFLELAQRLTSVRIEMDDLIQELTVLAEESDANPNRLDYLNALHNDLQRILHKHHAANVDELKRLQISLAEQLSDAADVDQAYAAAQQALAQRRTEVIEVGRRLMQSRQTIAAGLASGIMEKLQRLSMPDACLDFTWNEMTEPDAMGIEEVTIVFSANPGHPALPLQKVASGGEKSRLMLAFKATGQGSTSIPTIVLDEIDTGVSGKVAEEMAELMHQMAQQQQVISVTHLPQVAASADHHLKVSKRSVDAATRTEVTPLGTDARVQELAGMLSGSVVTEAAMAHASALLSKP
jgi:DNA repair protein RecN (Recombination protein N)